MQVVNIVDGYLKIHASAVRRAQLPSDQYAVEVDGLFDHQLGTVAIQVREPFGGPLVRNDEVNDLGVEREAALEIGAIQLGDNASRRGHTRESVGTAR